MKQPNRVLYLWTGDIGYLLGSWGSGGIGIPSGQG
jgi:hypothetical protein